MGQEIDITHFSDKDYQQFQNRLQDQLITLEKQLANPEFGEGAQTLGAEVELSIADNNLDPSLINEEIITKSQDPHLQHELNKYNLEYNLEPVLFNGPAFGGIKKQLDKAITSLNRQCQDFKSKVVPIGILPTLQKQHATKAIMTNIKRYQALADGIEKLRMGSINVDINGAESLKMQSNAITLEGANTSFQLQIRVPPSEFVDVFNAVQIATPLAVAVGANSPILFNKILWNETRIALFKQSVDCRRDEEHSKWRQPHRVSFGYGWVRKSALECFAENVALFPPLLPVSKPNDYIEQSTDGPDLYELRMHQGVVWHWNRAVYDPVDGGHLRIEMRSLPSGPTPIDMIANAAFLIGLAYAIKKDISQFLVSYPFMFAEYNFYRAAKHGLDAHLVWPLKKCDYSQSKPIKEILKHYIPQAADSLMSLGVDVKEVKQLMGIIESRIETRQNGADWQMRMVNSLDKRESREVAIKMMLEKYISLSHRGEPVHEWGLA